MIRRTLALSLAASLLAAGTAAAQDVPEDKSAIWTLQDENASISSANLTDKFYTNGLHLGYVSPTDAVPDFMRGIGRAIWDNSGQLRYALGLTQQIYTPSNTHLYVPLPGDEPYAGTLYGSFALYRDTPDNRSMLGMDLGLVGPWALGQEIQNGFHDLINQEQAKGWHTQLHNEPLLELNSSRVYRISTGSVFGMETDALPDLAVGLGNLRVYAQGGVIFRIGQGLDSDYGPSRLFPGMTGGDAFKPTRPFAWYVFVGADGQGVAHDLTLNGNSYGPAGPSVSPYPYWGEAEAGLTLMAFGARLTYTQVMQSQTFKHERGGPHQLGSLALSVRF